MTFVDQAVRRISFAIMLAGLVLAVSPHQARAQTHYPDKAVRIVLPFAAGGVADTTIRIIAEKLSDKLGQRFYVENQPGAGGIAAARTVISSAPDGYTLALLSNGTAISVSLFGKLPFDPLRDFEPISSLGFLDFIFATGAVFALLLYSLICDPLWTMISGIGLARAFAVVTLSPLRVRPVLVRCAALGCCLALLLISGAIGYLYTLAQYSGRVWFSDALAYVPQAFLASIVFISPKTMGSYYGLCALGWVLGLLFARGGVRVLVMAGLVSFGFVVIYGGTFLLMRKWWWPLPLYIEHSLFPLFTTSAVAGYWAALGRIKLPLFLLIKVRGKLASLMPIKQPSATPLSRLTYRIFHTQFRIPAAWLAALLVAMFTSATTAIYAVRAAPNAPRYPPPTPHYAHKVPCSGRSSIC
jgi:hypothetical protein